MADFNIAAAMNALGQQRAAQPLKYLPGTQTGGAKDRIEKARQFDAELAENKRQFGIDSEIRRAAAARSASSGGNTGGSDLNQWQQKLVGQGLANDYAKSTYQANIKKLGAEANGQDPLYYTIKDVLMGVDNNGGETGTPGKIAMSSADPAESVDALLRSLGTTSDEYFKRPGNSDLGGVYTSQKGKAASGGLVLPAGYNPQAETQ